MIHYDDDDDHLVFSTGKTIYCFGCNPGIGLHQPETYEYSYGSDGCFSIDHDGFHGDISFDEALEIADAMIETWTKHKEFLLREKAK